MAPHKHPPCLHWNLIYCSLAATICLCYKGDSSNDILGQSDHPDPHGSLDHPGGLLKDFAHTATTDESKLRLALLVEDKIDKNKDGLVQLDELVEWIKKCQDKYVQLGVNQHWAAYQRLLDSSGALGWQQYIDHEYEHMVTIAMHSSSIEQVEKLKNSHQFHLKRDLRRWQAADSNLDGKLSKSEFKLFLNPEYYAEMFPVMVKEKFERSDTNQDGKLSIDELVGELAVNDEARPNMEEHVQDIRYNKGVLHGRFDLDKSGYIDEMELASLLKKIDAQDHNIVEAQNLMRSADLDHDHRLTREEILGAYHEFVNSHATDFGGALQGPLPHMAIRDEL